jgi:hypothetical protein
MNASQLGYFQSLAEELRSQSNRIRQLIGEAHWGHDGRHKEVLLQNLVRRHCPCTVLVSTGFVISPTNPEIRSKEQDILVIDASTEAPLFHQGDLAIAFPHTVIAAISIKTTMDPKTIKDVIEGLASVRRTARDCNCKADRIWCGGFFSSAKKDWQQEPAEVYKSLAKHIIPTAIEKPILDEGLPHIFGPDVLAEATNLSFLTDYTVVDNKPCGTVRGYDCGGIAIPSNLLKIGAYGAPRNFPGFTMNAARPC